jgi:hypothetical protein
MGSALERYPFFFALRPSTASRAPGRGGCSLLFTQVFHGPARATPTLWK